MRCELAHSHHAVTLHLETNLSKNLSLMSQAPDRHIRDTITQSEGGEKRENERKTERGEMRRWGAGA